MFPNCCEFQSEDYYQQNPATADGDGIIAPSAASPFPSLHPPTKAYTHQLPVGGNLRESDGSGSIPDRIKDCSRFSSDPTESRADGRDKRVAEEGLGEGGRGGLGVLAEKALITEGEQREKRRSSASSPPLLPISRMVIPPEVEVWPCAMGPSGVACSRPPSP